MESIYFKQPEVLESTRIQFKRTPEITGKNSSRSFTIKGMDLDKIFILTKSYFEKLQEYGSENIKIVCYKTEKEDENNGKKTT